MNPQTRKKNFCGLDSQNDLHLLKLARSDFIQVYRMMHGIYNADYTKFYKLVEGSLRNKEQTAGSDILFLEYL